MAELRAENIIHLDEVKRFYLEATGSFTLVRCDKPRPGHPVIPGRDREFIVSLRPVLYSSTIVAEI